MPPLIRSVLAVLGGFATMMILVGTATAVAVRLMLTTAIPGTMPQPTPAYLAINLAYSGLFALIGGYATGFLAGRAPFAHCVALAGLTLLMGVLSMKQYAGQQPRWYQLVLAVCMPILVAGGGLLCAVLRRGR